jgi:hypothetical protein
MANSAEEAATIVCKRVAEAWQLGRQVLEQEGEPDGEPVLTVYAIDGWYGKSETVAEAEAITATVSFPVRSDWRFDWQMDRHKIWRIVLNNYAELEEGAADGYRAVVDVFVVGRPAPVRLDVVQTTRDPDFPWVFLAPENPDPDLPEPTRRILVPEQYVERIEIYLERTTQDMVDAEPRRLGFSYEVIDDPPGNGE